VDEAVPTKVGTHRSREERGDQNFAFNEIQ